MRVTEQAKELRPCQRGAGFVLDIPSGDLHAALGGERLDLLASSAGVLLNGRGSKIGPDEGHLETLWFNKLVSILSVCLGPRLCENAKSRSATRMTFSLGRITCSIVIERQRLFTRPRPSI